MRKTTLARGQLLHSVHMEKSNLSKVGLPGVVESIFNGIVGLFRRHKPIWPLKFERVYVADFCYFTGRYQ